MKGYLDPIAIDSVQDYKARLLQNVDTSTILTHFNKFENIPDTVFKEFFTKLNQLK